MARPLRLESEDGMYHVLNRGNYRADIFRSDKAKVAFLKCLGEACDKTGWQVHAWCIMSNHYHLAVSTPRANLVEGMRWLQGTFATRFNRLRQERGHLFQGRYKSLVVDPDGGLGPLCHYIHLNLCTRSSKKPQTPRPDPVLRFFGINVLIAQSTEKTNEHAMAKPGQNAGDARRAAKIFVQTNLLKSDIFLNSGALDSDGSQRCKRLEKALYYIGRASHTIEDMYSPSHRNPPGPYGTPLTWWGPIDGPAEMGVPGIPGTGAAGYSGYFLRHHEGDAEQYIHAEEISSQLQAQLGAQLNKIISGN